MPARTDHDRRDAQHASRAEIAVTYARYIRRSTEEAYAYIEEEAARYDGTTPIDWSAVGKAAAHRALRSYGIVTGPEHVIDARPSIEAVPAADGPQEDA